ncbi:MAG: calcium/sodium antiporter [Deltaproteobacteria bacterium]|nr:calcium/sodium antiporter [Deltaproteobacteria bacterium]
MDILNLLGNDTAIRELVAGLPSLALVIAIIVCIVLLSKGADWMIDGVVSLARRTGLSQVVIGATIVSLGTTTPEAFVSVVAAWLGDPGLALGNGVGSIIADTGLIFGVTCLLAAVPVKRYILNRTGLVQVGAATLLVVLSLFAWFASGGEPVLNRWVGMLLLVLLGWYLFATYRWARQDEEEKTRRTADPPAETMSLGRAWALIAAGLILVVAGARILVPCAAELAYRIGVPHDVIAATMVALGTSLPELMTAVASVRKGHPDITVGNIVGADVLNCLFVIGAAAATRPLAVPPNFFTFHFPAMLIILYSFRFFIVMNRDGRFKRWQGAWLLGIYLVYVILQYALTIGTGQA